MYYIGLDVQKRTISDCSSADAASRRCSQDEEGPNRCRQIADCLRCDFLPECHMASTDMRDRRRTLPCRNLVIKQIVQMKNRVVAFCSKFRLPPSLKFFRKCVDHVFTLCDLEFLYGLQGIGF
jgi:hypothetical protein